MKRLRIFKEPLFYFPIRIKDRKGFGYMDTFDVLISSGKKIYLAILRTTDTNLPFMKTVKCILPKFI